MLNRFKKNKKAFSLVELIIVIAIMVALVVVMAPALVKYVNRSHDAVVEAAAESVLQFVKAELSDGTLTGSGTIVVQGRQDAGDSTKYIHIDIPNTFSYPGGTAAFVEQCGADTHKVIKSNLRYMITVNDMSVEGHPQLVEIESEVNS